MNKGRTALALLICATPAVLQAQKTPAKSTATVKNTIKTPAKSAAIFKSNKDSVSYAVGVRIMQNLQSQGLADVNMGLLQKAMTDISQKKKLMLDDAAMNQCMNTYGQKLNEERMEKTRKENTVASAANRKTGLDFLANNAKRQGVFSLPSGLQYEIITVGSGTEHPKATSKVKCHYTGTLINGIKFDSSVDRGEPSTFSLNQVIAGWQEAIQLMTVGSKWKLYVPADLGYGDMSRGDKLPAGSTLLFDVELLGIEN